MAAPREFDVAIIGKGSCWTIQLHPPFKFGVLKELLVSRFGLVPSEANTLELRRVDEQPTRHNSSRLFGAATERPIDSDVELQAGDVQYIVGKTRSSLVSRCSSGCALGASSTPTSACLTRAPVINDCAPTTLFSRRSSPAHSFEPTVSPCLAGVAVSAAAAPAVVASLEDLLVAGGMRRTDVRKEVVRRAYTRYGGAVAGALAGAGRAEAAVDIYAMAASLPSLTTEADLRIAGLHVNGLLFEGGALVRCFRGREEFILKPLDARERGRALALHEMLTTRHGPIAGLTAFELHPRGDKLFMLMPRFGASLEHLAALDAEDALVLWRSVGGALRDLHALGFAHMDVKPANICVAGAQGFVLVDIGSVARFGEATSTTAPYVAADFPGAMRRSSAHADWWQLAMTLAEKACGERCLDVGACAVPTMAALAAHLQQHLPVALWRELEPLLQGGAA